MTRYFIELSYKGSSYSGWQIQPNAPSIQQTIQEALSMLLKGHTKVVGAGRTDTGVHASFYVAHFDTESSDDLSTVNFRYHLNSLLPKDIAVYRIYQVDMNMHSRFSAKSREYKYYINTRKDPFLADVAMIYIPQLNIKEMQKAADTLLEYYDFTSFSKLHTTTKTNNCNITYAKFDANDYQLIFTISADRFLRNMVRAIMGTLLDVGRGKISTEEFRNIILAKDRGKAKASAHACGLFLTNIKY